MQTWQAVHWLAVRLVITCN